MPVDQYIGGVEHAVLHLLYSRFFTKVLHDMGITDIEEPFSRLLTQGMVCKETFKCPEHGWLFPEEVTDGLCTFCGSVVEKGRVEKMSKSKKNVIDPDQLIGRYGADTSRLFSLFAAPPEKDLEWSDKGVEGAYRFLNRLWNVVYQLKDRIMAFKESTSRISTDSPIFRKTHQTIRKVTLDMEREYHFNTAIASMMELLNEVTSFEPKMEADYESVGFAVKNLILLLGPFSPHIAEELWEAVGQKPSLFRNPWPEWNEEFAQESEIELVVQINGKVRAKLMVSAGLKDDTIKNLALKDEKVREFIAGKPVKKLIVVKGRLVNIVV
jgi:leucyl-tRNA synthetase